MVQMFLNFNSLTCPLGRFFLSAFFMLILVALPSIAHAVFDISPPGWNLPEAENGKRYSLEITVTNTEKHEQTLNRVFHTCDCLEVEFSRTLLAPGESTKVRLALAIIDLPKDFRLTLHFEGDDLKTTQPFDITGKVKNGGKESVYAELPQNPSGKTLIIYFFFSPSCTSCDEIITGPVKDVLNKFKEKVGFACYDTSDPKRRSENYRLMRSFEEKFKVNSSAPVEVFLGESVIVGSKEVFANLLKTVETELAKVDGKSIALSVDDEKLYENISVTGAIIYGLIDGLNPCVFAGLILFFSYLLASGFTGKRLLQVGLVYCGAVFLTYFAIGFALFSFFYSSSAFPIAKKVVVMLSIAIASIGAIMSFRDSYMAHRGSAQKAWLQLPKGLKEYSARLVRSKKGKFAVFASVFALGVVLTVVEGACSGIQYIPACAMMVTVGETLNERFFGLGLLTIYNLAFVVPLLVLLFIVMSGKRFTSAKTLQAKNMFYIRLGTGIMLALVAVSMIILNFTHLSG